ncbi:hypothetical protein GLOTRDRAFT_137558 [Gloeophyllum trabeum ATCC 11539]|uniref:Matrin-type domain-containing protein n=1 Tax=Gloeophyllum trabeum (strain ATCC 11539 / FP-39264 / Madison 617) TaxID=670483 RepID=S7RRA3_GLOTA|nr:uncharacterized protein GLOTRDRAFT_137558 [Gloeophyllum trabeum ATCC 11539]EPQ57160.1 hypothetical protein GLOTRDRAFT_137558 [Gloeophyllum trabeum ATCC 11539]
MSEYWVSKKKYFCKYCEIYITDDAPSRRQHENGLRHQGNKERFVRGLYKASEKKKHDAEEERREMARVELAAQAAFAQDVGSGIARPSTSASSAPTASTSRKSAATPVSSSPWANYTTAESLGITDPDEERRRAEAERRRTMGVAGEWQIVTPTMPSQNASPAPEIPYSAVSADASQKRPAEAAPPEDDAPRGWKLKKKKLDVGLGEVYDPGLIPIKLKTKKEEPADRELPQVKTETEASASSSTQGSVISGNPNATPLPKWSKIQWKKPGEPSETSPAPESRDVDPAGQEVKQESPEAQQTVKAEDPSPSLPLESSVPPIDTQLKQEEEPSVKLEEPSSQTGFPAPSSGGGTLFKKRKAPPGTAGTRSRRGM